MAKKINNRATLKNWNWIAGALDHHGDGDLGQWEATSHNTLGESSGHILPVDAHSKLEIKFSNGNFCILNFLWPPL